MGSVIDLGRRIKSIWLSLMLLLSVQQTVVYYNGPLLWTKVHAGWPTIIAHDWGVKKSFEIPDVEDMEWTDILSQELMLMGDVLN